MDNALVPGLGGPMGRHALARGVWFNPLPWSLLSATLLFVALVARHVPCLQVDPSNQINVYIRLCYSDIQTTFLAANYGLGGSPLGGSELVDSPLVAMVMTVTVALVGLLGATIGPAATPQEVMDASVAFFAVSAVVLFVCFLVTVLALARLGPRAPGFQTSWLGWVFAVSPVVLAAGLIDWTLLPVALAAVGVLQVAQGRLLEGGIVLGLAACAGTMAIAVLFAATLAVALGGGVARGLRVIVPGFVTFVAVHLPLVLTGVDRVYAYYHAQINQDVGRESAQVAYGSLFYIVQRLGLEVREFASLTFVALLLALFVLVAYLYITERRPRLGSMVAAVVLLTTLLGFSFTPQTGLWVLFVVLLARPYRWEVVAVTVTQTLYVVAIWARLGGVLAESGSLYLWYWLAIIAQVAVQAWVLGEVLLDIARPNRDRLLPPVGEPLSASVP